MTTCDFVDGKSESSGTVKPSLAIQRLVDGRGVGEKLLGAGRGMVRNSNRACIGKSALVNGRIIGDISYSHLGLRTQYYHLYWVTNGGLDV